MSLLSGIINLAVKTVKLINDKAKFTDIVMHLIATLPSAILNLIAAGKLDNEGKLDEALAELDVRTGSDLGALDVVHDLPPDKEELLFDHLKGIVEILGKNKLGVAGYTEE
jgi:hypothetical protein